LQHDTSPRVGTSSQPPAWQVVKLTKMRSPGLFKIAQWGIFFCGQNRSPWSFYCLWFFVQHSIQQGRVDLKVAVVVDVAQLPKPIHKVAHAGASCANHVRERLLADLRDDRFGSTVLAKIRQQEKGLVPGASRSN
jgi:hypothetical protein